MRIVADKDIPYAKEAFSGLGDLTLLPCNEILPNTIKNAEILIIRAATPVTRELIENSRIRFIGTTSIGEDHVNKQILRELKIGFASAAGSSAQGVAEFVLLLWNHFNQMHQCSFENSTLGIIGAGNIGSCLFKLANAIGIPTLLCDPPLAEKTGNKEFVSLDTILNESDVISLHIPLVTKGKYPTQKLMNTESLGRIKKGAVLINTSRGNVIDESALSTGLKRLSGLILDVFSGEPDVKPSTLRSAHIATPHIAGYTLEGKTKAAEMIHQAICRYYKIKPFWTNQDLNKKIQLDLSAKKHLSLAGVLSQIHDVKGDHCKLLDSITQQNKKESFKNLRSNYSLRREFTNHQILLNKQNDKITSNLLINMGFTTLSS